MNKLIKGSIILSIFFMLLNCNSSVQEDNTDARTDEWINLFDGESLNGWSVHSGTATYKIEDGVIVGTTAKGSPNSFLCTDREFGDFILEFEVLLPDSQLNSGVQFRSKIAEEEMVFWFRNEEGEPQPRTIPKDRVYGYQVEIATENSGGVYDEARRAFMPWRPEEGSEAGKAFTVGEWNNYRIECQGNSIKTMVNGIICADFKDSLNESGIIGLQVHGIGKDQGPYEVRWRNIRIKPFN